MLRPKQLRGGVGCCYGGGSVDPSKSCWRDVLGTSWVPILTAMLQPKGSDDNRLRPDKVGWDEFHI